MPQKGKILLYNVNEGNGLIMGENGNKYKFDMQNWDDFDNFPQTGMLITFEDSDTIALNIKKSNEEELEKAKKEKEEDPDPNIEDLSAKNVEKDLLDRRLDSFFSDMKDLDEDDLEMENNDKTLDFFKIKRFMFTAFNNLVDLDSSILEDQNITTLYSQITELQSRYDKYKKTYLYPKLAFSNIFLKYTNHQKAQRRLELNLNEMGTLKATLEPLESEIKLKLKRLSLTSKNTPEFNSLFTSVKKTKKLYVDTIDQIGDLREENEKLLPILDEYYDLFYEEFIDKFELNCRESLNHLGEVLNSLAYAFDKFLWAKAKKSKIVSRFFKDSGIMEDYSSLTYLKYYLRALDTQKLSPEQKELFELQEYLKKRKTATDKGD